MGEVRTSHQAEAATIRRADCTILRPVYNAVSLEITHEESRVRGVIHETVRACHLREHAQSGRTSRRSDSRENTRTEVFADHRASRLLRRDSEASSDHQFRRQGPWWDHHRESAIF